VFVAGTVPEEIVEEFSRLVELMERLRSDEGCPWDRKQMVGAFKTFMLEEVYELIDAIEKADDEALKEELGDLLFHIVFVAQICRERGIFDIRDVIEAVYRKMYHRHPHVFGGTGDDTPIEQRWEDLKRQEKEDYHPLKDIPLSIPALLRAYIISKRVSRVGFDWERIEDVHAKLFEEIEELKRAETQGDRNLIREEIGDLLFTVSNISRFHDIDHEDALRATTEKFIRRFSYIEARTDLSKATLDTMDRLWNEVKALEKEGE
jgi:tetrapyrrole methylase family protein / MazG family protein